MAVTGATLGYTATVLNDSQMVQTSCNPDTTRPGILVPLMSKRLADLDTKTIAAWLEKEAAQAPTSTAKAFSVLRAFLAWCVKQEKSAPLCIPMRVRPMP